jgi:alkanesulfonate monooxygenase SsuD/methylene tetrahydromethanopterin reductase-like flavin-dependent oxidoreductase (luciferase family)
MGLPVRFGVAYDFRNPVGSGRSTTEVYREILDQIVDADRLGLDLVWLTEHHFVEDGYLPAWVPVAGAIAARTSRIRIGTDIALLPFHHPIRLAEDVAVLDQLSNGRMDLGLGMGYAPHEFEAFGVSLKHRVSLMEEGIAVLRAAWSGEPFSFEGKRWRFRDLRVTPDPVQPGGPPLWLAAMTEAGARRAARFGCHFLPQGNRSETLDVWRADLASAGTPADAHRVGIVRSWLVTDDRERDWPPIRDAERYRMGTYAKFFEEAQVDFGLGGADAIPQAWVVGDEDHVTEKLGAFIEAYGITDLVTWGVPPGLSAERTNESLERFARGVMPRLKARFGG